MGTKERLRLTVRWMCFALLLTATALRLCAEVGIQGFRQTWERFRKSDETPTVLTSEAPTDATFPTMLYIPPAAGAALTSEDAALGTVINRAGVSFDAEELMCRPLPLTCTSDEPLILIVHTHASEAYSGGDYVESGAFHTTDPDNNVVAVGQALADTLNACGIKTLHDMTLNDVPDYSGAYERTEEVILRYLEEYPSIQMVIDVHRDAVTDADGAELAMTASLDGQSAAQLLFVMGTDAGGLPHPNWQGNLALAMQLQAYCTKSAPNLFRELSLRGARYNEHLTPCSVLLEVGAAGNTLDEAIRSVEFLGEKLAELIQMNSES